MENSAESQQHIARTASVYANIPLSKPKLLNTAIKKVAAGNFAPSPAPTKKEKKQSALAAPQQYLQGSRSPSPLLWRAAGELSCPSFTDMLLGRASKPSSDDEEERGARYKTSTVNVTRHVLNY